MSTRTPSTPPQPLSSADVAWTEWSDVPRFGVRYRHLSSTALGEDHRVGVAIEELAPGRQTAPAHYHALEEEHVYILEGRLSLRLGAQRFPMQAGDYVCFPAGQKAGHCLINDSDATCRYVIIGERNPDDVIVYTDSRKVLVRSLGRRALLDLDAVRGYWDGEDTGLPATTAAEEAPAAIDIAPAASVFAPISSDGVPWEDTDEGPRFGGLARHLTYAAVGESYRVGVMIESPAPGKRLAPRHYHMREEEHALVLEGTVTLLLGDEQHTLQAGDYVAFAAGLAVGHAFLNPGPGPCRYLMIGQRNPDDVCIYPDSGKMAVKALDNDRVIFDLGATRGYWDGE
jgi:uncharacterized cupin superfamily protein